MSDTDTTPAKKPRRRKAIDRGWSVDTGDNNDVMRDRGGYRAPKQPTGVADLTEGAIFQGILLAIRTKNAVAPEVILGHRHGFTPTAECPANLAFTAALHRDDASWNAGLAFLLLGEAAVWAVREDARAAFRAANPAGTLTAEHDAINAAVRAAIEPLLPPYLKGA